MFLGVAIELIVHVCDYGHHALTSLFMYIIYVLDCTWLDSQGMRETHSTLYHFPDM